MKKQRTGGCEASSRYTSSSTGGACIIRPGHRSPAPPRLIAQALVETMTIVTMDGIFASYEANTLW
jgi:PIN domain nuclease of toxin-antitoxin system